MTLAPANSHGSGYPLGLTGATAATRYVGGTTSGAPVAGTFAVGDYVIGEDGSIFVCTVAGSPGTWVNAGGGVSLPVSIASGGTGQTTVDAARTALGFLPKSYAGYTPLDPFLAEPLANANQGANVAVAYWFILEDTATVNRIVYSIAVQSGNLDVGIYLPDGPGGQPLTRVVSKGSFACPAAARVSTTITGQVLTPGLYWAMLAADNAVVQYGYNTIAFPAAIRTNAYQVTASFPLPATLSGVVSSTSGFLVYAACV